MLMYIYLAILALLTVLIVRNMFRSKSVLHYFEAMLVLIPFIMRLLLIK